ncbi:MAG: bifunctional 2-polyprenyl-6-hydroxyphenol methylase/3-demethylubiquinol 3-O-methyltransferase UbiG [Pseudomonadota bacterium]
MLDKSELKKVSENDQGVSPEEIARFDRLAQAWWDPQGEYKAAIAFNEARVSYFVDKICQHFNRDSAAQDCLSGLSVLDLGCGGGLVSEALARFGADVTGIDASELSIQVAKRHALKSGLKIHYEHTLARELIQRENQFDVVLNAEVIEHVPDQKGLVKQCSKLAAKDGLVILATLNRTITAYLIAIIGAEYIMRYLPIGTHSWGHFVTPLQLNSWASLAQLKLLQEIGMRFNPFSKKWSLTNSLRVNYVQTYRKM